MMTQTIAAAGSHRCYTRHTHPNGTTYIRVEGTNRQENHAFIYLSRHFHDLGLPVPEIYEVAEDEMWYTQQDLGDTLLFDAIRSGRENGTYNEKEIHLLTRTIRTLAHIQIKGAQGMDWSVCFPVSEFDRRTIMWDLNYFKYCFLKLSLPEFSEPLLEDDFENMAEHLLMQPGETFLYRDFQSRNVMVKDGNPYFIDYQGGRRGPIYYDLASFLWQAKANFPNSLREELISHYIDELREINHSRAKKGQIVDCQCFNRETLSRFVLFRTLQVLGAYGLRGLIEKKAHFIESIPFAIHNLRALFEQHSFLQNDYPYIYQIAQQL